MSFEPKPGLTVIWNIENFSFCHNNLILESPTFRTDKVTWKLELRLADKDSKAAAYICKVGGPPYATIYLEFGLIKKDNDFAYHGNFGKCVFSKKSDLLYTSLDTKIALLDNQDVLCNDTLKLYCRLWKPSWKITEAEELSIITRVGVLKRSLLLSLEEFDSIPSLEEKDYIVSSPSGGEPLCTLKLNIRRIERFKQIVVKVFAATSRIPYEVKCKITIVNSFEKIEGVHFFDSFRNYSYLLPRIKCEHLQKDNYTSNDVLTLACECIVSDGIEFSKIVSAQSGDPQLHNSCIRDGERLEFATDLSPGVSTFSKTESHDSLASLLPDRTSVLNFEETNQPDSDQDSDSGQILFPKKHEPQYLARDLLTLYEEGTLADFTMHVSEVAIRVHKAVLSARSPVFKAMTCSYMKEANDDRVDIQDLDLDTVRFMLRYIYTDSTEDLNWEMALKLYFAADKYGLNTLRDICSSLLISSLCQANVCQILTLSDRHTDSVLKQAAWEFLCDKGSDIIGSPEWKAFMQQDIHLSAETMQFMYLKSRKKM